MHRFRFVLMMTMYEFPRSLSEKNFDGESQAVSWPLPLNVYGHDKGRVNIVSFHLPACSLGHIPWCYLASWYGM